MTLARPALGLAAVLPVLVAGCGEPSGPHVSDAVQKTLPTHQHALPEEACPDILGMPERTEERMRRRGQRQLRALIAAYKRNPDSVVETTWTTGDEEPRLRHENITVSELLATHLSTAEEVADGLDQSSGACFEDLAHELRAAQDSQ
jgi:hypothetical protein